jgi:hypothetical protein
VTQVSRTIYKSTTATDFPNNTTGLISPSDLRGQLDNIADSSPFMTTNKIAAPTVNDDSAGTGGNGTFGLGDIWIDTNNDNSYICVDATPTDAVWYLIGGANTVFRGNTVSANQMTFWSANGVINGDTNLTWNGTTFSVTGNMTVTGNITVTGIVDGRDIATDGSKLDGIEDNATADLTGAEIKALYEAEADTNAFTDAEQSKLAGIGAGAEVNTVDKVGITADNQIGVWTGDGTIEGDANLTWSGTDLAVAGNVIGSGYITSLQRQVAETGTYRRVLVTDSGTSFEMDNAGANTIEIVGELNLSITGATQADPVVITVADTDGLETGDTVDISGIIGMTELNGNSYTITVINGTTFSLDGVDGTGFDAYVSDGDAYRPPLDYPEGFFFEVIQKGNGATTLQAGANVTLNGSVAIPTGVSGTITARYDVIRVRKMSSQGWIVNGDIGAIS